jgi:hypothetical protein
VHALQFDSRKIAVAAGEHGIKVRRARARARTGAPLIPRRCTTGRARRRAHCSRTGTRRRSSACGTSTATSSPAGRTRRSRSGRCERGARDVPVCTRERPVSAARTRCPSSFPATFGVGRGVCQPTMLRRCVSGKHPPGLWNDRTRRHVRRCCRDASGTSCRPRSDAISSR